MGNYILALDQGTSSSRAILFNKKGEKVATSQKELNQYYPEAGLVEQNPMEIWETQLFVAQNVLQKTNIPACEIHAIGITNQRETTVVWDKNTGKPIYNAIVWQDKRTAEFCKQLSFEGWDEYIRENTGLVLDSYFSATKVHWILNNVAGAKEKAANGELLFGTVDTWLIWNLTNGKVHVTDYTNASRTLMFNISTLEWDSKLLSLFDIPKLMLPAVVTSSSLVGHTGPEFFDGCAIPIAGIAGDQQSALFGQTSFKAGLAKNTYGTGCFILMNTGPEKITSQHGLLTTLTCSTKKGEPHYALEGSVFIAGAAIKWLRDALHLISDATETETIAENLPDTEGVYVVPAFSGLGAPYWDMYARGGILGLTLGTTNQHIIKATLESLAYQSKDVILAMEKDFGKPIEQLNVDGGACVNNYLMQFQADLLNAQVIRPQTTETTALGAAFLAGLATKFWEGYDELLRIRAIERTFTPKKSTAEITALYQGWQNAVKRISSNTF